MRQTHRRAFLTRTALPALGALLSPTGAAPQALPSAAPPRFDYRPDGMAMWDAWFLPHGDQVHAYYLQRLAPDSARTQAEADSLGHAVSRDLLHWEEKPIALPPGPAGSLDDLQHYTGSAIEHAGTSYLFYTMRHSGDAGRRQRLGVATSKNLDRWERHPRNPVIEPDERWYAGPSHPDPGGVVDCRDLVVIREPNRDAWLGFYATRLARRPLGEGGAIAVVRSRNLLDWEHLPPAFAPERYACIEVPEVLPLDNRWYMMCLAAHDYGNRGIFRDPFVSRGTIYAVADRPEGPYRELPDDQLVIGGDVNSGFTCRTVQFRGETHVLYVQPVPGGPATLSPPMRLRTVRGGGLRLACSPLTRAWRGAELLGTARQPNLSLLPSHNRWIMPSGQWTQENGVLRGTARSGWQLADASARAHALEAEATILLVGGAAAGFAWGPLNSSGRSRDLLFLLDAEAQAVRCLERPWLPIIASRQMPIERGRPVHVRLCVRPPRAELYLDDILTLQLPVPVGAGDTPHGLGLVVDRGTVEVRNLRAWALRPNPPLGA